MMNNSHQIFASNSVVYPFNGCLCIIEMVIKQESTEENIALDPIALKISFVLGSEGFVDSSIQSRVINLKKGEMCYFEVSDLELYSILKSNTPIKDATEKIKTIIELRLLEWAEFLDISPKHTGEILIIVEDEETSWDTPLPLSQVAIQYIMKTDKGEIIEDYTSKNELVYFTVDEGQVMEGIDLAVQQLTLTTSWAYVILKGQYAYSYNSEKHNKEKSNNQSTHLQSLKLISLTQFKQSCELNLEEKKQRAEHMQALGNSWYKKSNFDKAIRRYEMGIDALEYLGGQSTSKDYASVKNTLIFLNLNIAQALLSQKNYSSAIDYCNIVLKLDSSSVKAYYRKIKCFIALEQLDKAEPLCHECLCLFPRHQIFRNTLHSIEVLYRKDHNLIQTYQAIWKR